MKVQFLQSVGEVKRSWAKGVIVSLPKSEAEYYIRTGLAEEIEEEKTEVRPLKKKVQTRPVNKKE